jgi:hypothetical protein
MRRSRPGSAGALRRRLVLAPLLPHPGATQRTPRPVLPPGCEDELRPSYASSPPPPFAPSLAATGSRTATCTSIFIIIIITRPKGGGDFYPHIKPRHQQNESRRIVRGWLVSSTGTVSCGTHNMFRWDPRAGPTWIHEIFVWDPH